MSRKTLLMVFAVLGAIVSALALSPQAAAAIVSLGAVVVYISFEAKADIAAQAAQKAKFTDPKFWITVISAIIGALATAGINLPISPEIIVGVLTAIVAILFKAKPSARIA
jgi:uncharacterized membrane protein